MKLFEKKIKNEQYIPTTDSVYSPFDPGLSIDGVPMKFIIDPSEKDAFKAVHFKFLGRWLNSLLSEKNIKDKISAFLANDIAIIDSSKLNGFMKLWLYQFYTLSHLSWPFLINDLDNSFALDLQRSVNQKLKSWAGIGCSVDNRVLFRPKHKFGLGITPISYHYQCMQMTKCELLRTSKDPTIVKLYKTRETLNAKLTRTWKATKALTVANAEVDLNLNFPSQQNTQGLGFGIFNPNPTCSEQRKLISAKKCNFS